MTQDSISLVYVKVTGNMTRRKEPTDNVSRNTHLSQGKFIFVSRLS